MTHLHDPAYDGLRQPTSQLGFGGRDRRHRILYISRGLGSIGSNRYRKLYACQQFLLMRVYHTVRRSCWRHHFFVSTSAWNDLPCFICRRLLCAFLYWAEPCACSGKFVLRAGFWTNQSSQSCRIGSGMRSCVRLPNTRLRLLLLTPSSMSSTMMTLSMTMGSLWRLPLLMRLSRPSIHFELLSTMDPAVKFTIQEAHPKLNVSMTPSRHLRFLFGIFLVSKMEVLMVSSSIKTMGM